MSDRLQLLENGQTKCGELHSRYPDSVALQAVARQIEYLIGLERDGKSDRSHLKNITIGVLTAREIEPLDGDAAEIFYKIASAAKLM